jgi:hypothetical protein
VYYSVYNLDYISFWFTNIFGMIENLNDTI